MVSSLIRHWEYERVLSVEHPDTSLVEVLVGPEDSRVDGTSFDFMQLGVFTTLVVAGDTSCVLHLI